MNRAVIIGNVGKDPELKYTQSGTAVVNLSVATTEFAGRDEAGNKLTSTEWHRVTVFGKQAESCAEYVRKGSKVAVEGSIRYGSYEKEGVTMYTTDIVADRVEFLTRASAEG